MDDRFSDRSRSSTGFDVRHPRSEDYLTIVDAIEAWWTALQRPANALVQRLFLEHFNDTSFVVLDDERLVAFLIGFLSQSQRQQAYIHFAGVAPQLRRQGFGRQLYESFFKVAREGGRSTVRCITSPSNKASLTFHRRLGFEPVDADDAEDGIPVHRDHGGRGIPMVVLERYLPVVSGMQS